MAALVDVSVTILTFSPCCLKKPLSLAICMVTSSDDSRAPTVMLLSSGALDPVAEVVEPLELEEELELHAARPTASMADASTGNRRRR